MRPRTVGAIVAGGLLAGGTGMVLSAPGLLSASAPPDETTAVDDTTAEDTEEDADSPFDLAERLQDMLQPLADDGTLTQEQVDSMLELLEIGSPRIIIEAPGLPSFPDRPRRDRLPGLPEFPAFPGEIIIEGPFGPRDHHVRSLFGGTLHQLDAIADAIGVEASELGDELRSGSTIAEVAEANGVDPQAVIDALVAQAEERITDLVHGAADDSDTTETTEPTETTTA